MPSTLNTILVRSPNWIGDQIIAYPFFYHLRAAFPQARIAAICVPWVEAVQFRNLVDEVFVLPKAGKSFLAGAKNMEMLARELRSRGRWDLGISLPNSFSSAWLLFRAGAKRRRGYFNDGRALLLTEGLRLRDDGTSHRAQIFADLLPKEAPSTNSAAEFWSRNVPPFDPAAAWPQTKTIEPPVEPFWILAPGSMAESRRWPAENFAATAREIHSHTGWKGIVVGGPSETLLASKLVGLTGGILSDWTARGTVTSYWKLFNAAKFTLANDSGLAHMAAHCGTPGRSLVQVVWGAGDPKRTRPLGPAQVKLLFNPVHCWPCERNNCSQPPGRKLECLLGIGPSAVWREIAAALQNQTAR